MNPRVKNSRMDECDELPNSIKVTVPPLGISVFRCTRMEPDPDEVLKQKEKKSLLKAAKEDSFRKKNASAGKGIRQQRLRAVAKRRRKKSLKEELEEKTQREDYN